MSFYTASDGGLGQKDNKAPTKLTEMNACTWFVNDCKYNDEIGKIEILVTKIDFEPNRVTKIVINPNYIIKVLNRFQRGIIKTID